MPDKESRVLDQKILTFIRRYSEKPAPEMAFEWLALEIFSYQYRRNALYRKYCDFEKKTPANVKNWKNIPALPALAFKELVLTSFPVGQKVGVFHTSGTSNGPKGAHFFDTFKLYETSILPPFLKFILPDARHRFCTPGVQNGGFCLYFLVPSFAEAPYSSLCYMMNVLNRRLADGKGRYYVKKSIPQFESLRHDLEKEKKKVILFSTVFALKSFLDFLSSKGTKLSLARGSRLMETGGFKGRTSEISKKKLYSLCQKFLGIPGSHCVSEYGMTELSSQFYDSTLSDKHAGLKRKPVKMGPVWLKTLVIDPRTDKEAVKGRTGLLRHFDLANRASVIAVQTEDLGRALEEGFELLGRAKGSEARGCSLTYEQFLSLNEPLSTLNPRG